MVKLVFERGDWEWFIQFVFIPVLLLGMVVAVVLFILN